MHSLQSIKKDLLLLRRPQTSSVRNCLLILIKYTFMFVMVYIRNSSKTFRLKLLRWIQKLKN